MQSAEMHSSAGTQDPLLLFVELVCSAYVVESDGLCLIERLMETLDEDELEVAVTVARKIWLCRNYVVYGGNFLPSDASGPKRQRSRGRFYSGQQGGGTVRWTPATRTTQVETAS